MVCNRRRCKLFPECLLCFPSIFICRSPWSLMAEKQEMLSRKAMNYECHIAVWIAQEKQGLAESKLLPSGPCNSCAWSCRLLYTSAPPDGAASVLRAPTAAAAKCVEVLGLNFAHGTKKDTKKFLRLMEYSVFLRIMGMSYSPVFVSMKYSAVL